MHGDLARKMMPFRLPYIHKYTKSHSVCWLLPYLFALFAKENKVALNNRLGSLKKNTALYNRKSDSMGVGKEVLLRICFTSVCEATQLTT